MRCGSLGIPSTDCNGNPIRIFSNTECVGMGGIHHASGECTDPKGGSYSYDCRNNRFYDFSSRMILRLKCENVNGFLGVASTDCAGNPIFKYTRAQCEGIFGGIYHASGECTRPEGGSYSFDCASLELASREPVTRLPSNGPVKSIKSMSMPAVQSSIDLPMSMPAVQSSIDLPMSMPAVQSSMDMSTEIPSKTLMNMSMPMSVPPLQPSMDKSTEIPSKTLMNMSAVKVGGYPRRKHNTRGNNRRSGTRKNRK